MKIHELKTICRYFKEVWDEEKRFEVRKNDRNFKVGDLLLLRELFIHPNNGNTNYTGCEVLVLVEYILSDVDYCKEGYVIIGFKEIHRTVHK